MASTKARNASVAYNMRAVGGLLGGERQLANFKKLRFENKYKDVPPEEKEALFLKGRDEFALPEAEDTERLHKVRQATAARQFEALQALPKFGVATYANTRRPTPIWPRRPSGAGPCSRARTATRRSARRARSSTGSSRAPSACAPLAHAGARMHQGVSREDEWRVIGLGRLDNVKLHAAFVDAKARGSTVELVGVEDPTWAAWRWTVVRPARARAVPCRRGAARSDPRAHRGRPSLPGTPPRSAASPGSGHAGAAAAAGGARAAPAPASRRRRRWSWSCRSRARTTSRRRRRGPQKDDEEPAAAPAEQTPNAKPAPEAPPSSRAGAHRQRGGGHQAARRRQEPRGGARRRRGQRHP